MDQDIEKIISLHIQLKKALFEPEKSKDMAVGADGKQAIEKRVGTFLQYHVLFFLEKHPKSTLTEIANYACGTPSSTTQLIERLHKADLVDRKVDNKDRRLIRHSLTKQGAFTVSEIKKGRISQAKKIFSNLDDTDRKELIRILEKLLHNVDSSNR